MITCILLLTLVFTSAAFLVRRQGNDVFTLQFVTQAPQGASGSCQDAIPNCSSYGTTVCSDSKYATWVKQNCAAFCQTCSGSINIPTPAPATSAPATGGCQDKIATCSSYGQTVCSNAGYKQWVAENCPAFCKVCSGSSGGGGVVFVTVAPTELTGGRPATACTDTLATCSSYGQTVCSNPTYRTWAESNCAKFCNLCSGGSGSNQPSIPVTVAPNTFTQGGSGCAYKGKVYQQSESWDDACTYKCTCSDANSGRYECRTKCVTWSNLPPVCHMDPPAPGKCCEQPICPPSVTLQYPPGYTLE